MSARRGDSLSAREARRIALAAQGLADARAGARASSPQATGGQDVRAPEGSATPQRLRRLVERLGVVQIDSVNVLARAHYLPTFSRLGPYPRKALEDGVWGERRWLFEYWGHEASLLPLALQPLFRWRMARARAGETWTGLARFARERRAYIDAVLERIEREGPLTGGELADAKRVPGWWSWTDGKRALEWLFWAGLLTVRTRRGFERVYDLPERVLPRAVQQAPTPEEPEAIRELVRIAARALGVATEADLRDYFRLPLALARAAVADLTEAGALQPVMVEGWRRPAFLLPGARVPRRANAAALLSPFDNLIWTRERTQRLFGARVRLEIYTPAHKREHGYYVLPFLQGEAITARVDLKADRQAGVLRVQAAHLEPGADADAAAPSLAVELRTMARWLGLANVRVAGTRAFAQVLSTAL